MCVRGRPVLVTNINGDEERSLCAFSSLSRSSGIGTSRMTTDSRPEISSLSLQTECVSKPAMEVITDLPRRPPVVEVQRRAPGSVCEVCRETIELGLSQGRNALGIRQDLVDGYGF
jgi:hypothetical protein